MPCSSRFLLNLDLALGHEVEGLQTFFKTNIAVDDVVVCAPTSGRVASVEIVGGLDVVAFLLAVGEGRLDQLLVLRVVQIAVCRRDGPQTNPSSARTRT